MPLKDATGKRLSGAQQRKLQKQADESEATPADVREAAAFERLKRELREAPHIEAAASYVRFAVERAGCDPAASPASRVRRQQVISGGQALAKAADPARKIAELQAELERSIARIEQLEALLRAANARRDDQSVAPSLQ